MRIFGSMVLAVVLVFSGWCAADGELATNELTSIDQTGAPSGGQAGDRRWYERVEIGGFANAGYVLSGKNGTQKFGHFYASERLFGAGLFVDAELLDSVGFHNELTFYDMRVGLKEMYFEWKDIFAGKSYLSLKAGRMDIPFGEEYLWQNSPDNPMALRTAAWPWGYSHGLLFFGKAGPLGYFASVMDGEWTSGRDEDDLTFKSLTGRLTFDPLQWLHVGMSYIENGKHDVSAYRFNEVGIKPVGATSDTNGPSPSAVVGFRACEVDLTVKAGTLAMVRGNYGMIKVLDSAPGYGRTIQYWFAEALVNVSRVIYVVGRYSIIGTFNARKGYQFGGDYDGASDFDYDLRSFGRYGAAVGFRFGRNLVLKVEADSDQIRLIDQAVAAGIKTGKDRWTFLTEIAAKF